MLILSVLIFTKYLFHTRNINSNNKTKVYFEIN